MLFLNFSFAYTESEVNSKVEQLENVVNKVFSNSTFKKKYAPIFKKTFESCAKSCKDEVNKQASIKIGEKYYGGFNEQKTEDSAHIKENMSENENISNIEIKEETKTETKNEYKCWNQLNWPIGVDLYQGTSQKMRYALYWIADEVKWNFIHFPDEECSWCTNNQWSKLTDEEKNRVRIWETTRDENTYFIEIIADKNAIPWWYTLQASTDCSLRDFSINIYSSN